MGAADMVLFGLLVVANMAILSCLHRRRQRRLRRERMMRSLRAAVERQTGAETPAITDAAPVLLRLSC